ncbi:MAG TPA: PIG-L family deacetylase, partial [Gemmatimonadaceae bacterium]|nr:PIG-L family deacetylase [Gemmatimonadaceae bacterium]
MVTGMSLGRALVALALVAPSARAQAWRHTAAGVGTTARVLIIGTRPQDEDNALIAWLSLGRRVETAFLSLTRGESGPNVAGNERQAPLAIVRTAELLAERSLDGAHQYFTRAYDFGPTRSDSVVAALWPYDSLLADMAAVIRAYRPHVVISPFADSTDRDATHRFTTRLIRDAIAVAADTVRLSTRASARIEPWTVRRLLVELDSAAPGAVKIDVGEFDRATGHSYAELGAEFRQLQRTQRPVASPPVGHLWRFLALADSSRPAGEDETAPDLFAGIDTSWNRFRAVLDANGAAALDSLHARIEDVRARAAIGDPDSLARLLARTIGRVARPRAAIACPAPIVPTCGGALGDLAVSLARVRATATDALVGALGIVIDGTVDRALVAAGDSVAVNVRVYNGGRSPIALTRLGATSHAMRQALVRDTTVVAPDSTRAWTAYVRPDLADGNWWQRGGLVRGTAIHSLPTMSTRPVMPQMITGEDRIPSGGVDAGFAIGDANISVADIPLVQRPPGYVRGDVRHPLAGIRPISVLIERTAEYERANLPVDRIFRVYVQSLRDRPESLTVGIQVPKGLRADPAQRTIVLPAFGDQNMFFRLGGLLTPGSDSISASAQVTRRIRPVGSPAGTPQVEVELYQIGTIVRDYPHIPSQVFLRLAGERLEVVDVRVPRWLRVAYVKGTDELKTPLGQLQVNVQTLEPSLLSVVDLSGYSTVLIGAGALAQPAVVGALPALTEFVRRGGTLVVLAGGNEVAQSGLLPFPITLDTVQRTVIDPAAPLHVLDPRSAILNSPNRITASDFDDWTEARAVNVPISVDPRYRTVVSVDDTERRATSPALVVARLG